MKKSAVKNKKRSALVRVYLFGALAALLLVFSLLAPFLAPNDPYATNADAIKLPPSAEYPFGTDFLGRCVCSRVFMGARTTIFASLALVAVSFVFGTALGLVSGYYGGALDSLIMRLTDMLLAFPQMVLAIAVAGILNGGLLGALIALGVTGWTLYARLARSHALRLKNESFVLAARLSGCGDLAILLRHILPNMLGSLLVSAAMQIGTTMIGVAGLSFLGLGVVPPHAEWGSMINEARAYVQLAPWTVLAPALCMVAAVMLFNYLGDSLRDLAEEGGWR